MVVLSFSPGFRPGAFLVSCEGTLSTLGGKSAREECGISPD